MSRTEVAAWAALRNSATRVARAWRAVGDSLRAVMGPGAAGGEVSGPAVSEGQVAAWLDYSDAMRVPQRFRARPVEVDAMRFDGHNGEVIAEWTEGAMESDGPPWYLNLPDGSAVRVAAGDWVIKDAGEFCLCKPYVFEATYELVDTRL